MTQLYVDVDALNELSRQLQQIRSSLEHASGTPDAYAGRLGSSKMEGALDDFVGGWTDGRKKIVQAIDGLQEKIHGAIEAYQKQEQALSGAAGTEG